MKSTEFNETPRLWAKFMEKDKSYSVQAFDFDCKDRLIALTSVAKYSKDEELVGNSDTGNGWQRIIPQSRGEQMHIGMCGK